MELIKKIMVIVFGVVIALVLSALAFFVSLKFLADETANDKDLPLAQLSAEYDVELGKLYSVSGSINTVYTGLSWTDEEESVDTSYVLLDNGIFACFYERFDSYSKGDVVKLKGRASYFGGIVMLDNCTIIEDEE